MRSEPPPGWRLARLGDLVSIEHGFAFKSKFFSGSACDVPIVVSVGNFDYSGGFRFGSTAIKGYVGEFPDRFRLVSGDVLLVMTCQTQGGEILGIPGRIPDDGRVYLHNQRLGRVVFDHKEQLDPDFAYWLFLNPAFNRTLCRTATGSKILHTAPSRIEAYAFALPPLGDQRRIASILSALDNKIGSNRRLASLLEETAAVVFRARFVDFVGVEDFEETERGRIPVGWKTGTLTDVGRFVNGKAFTKEANG
jgi:type I restriction enzyme, S subunit